MSDHLFVYGTLLIGHEPAPMAETCRRFRRLGPATVIGRLYDLGPYPAAMVGNQDRGVIRGEVVQVDCEETWRRLDSYEGCPRPGEGDGLFRRVRAVAMLESGESVDCWIYVYNRDLSQASLIECGCWRAHRGVR